MAGNTSERQHEYAGVAFTTFAVAHEAAGEATGAASYGPTAMMGGRELSWPAERFATPDECHVFARGRIVESLDAWRAVG